ncbi:hypothetical protein GGD57_004145 [Rhizobium esperanzae]|uniref:Uncharacterized protein n=1 Tax=Rhizobium esperanzae TaxID=1967781 RepID=A0A7W6R621_9HYPH|nr:hypothetical protein [Rhizobium esperanzae]
MAGFLVQTAYDFHFKGAVLRDDDRAPPRRLTRHDNLNE